MERFAFSLDEDAKKWLQVRSDELDISRAELLRRLIAHARGSDTPVIDGDTVGDTPSDTVGDTHGRSDTVADTHGDAAVAAWALEVLREADRECRRADVPLDALDDDRKPDTVWLEVVRPALLAVAAEADAVETSTNDQRYRWVGE